MEVLKLENIYAGFGGKLVLKGLHLSLKRGEVLLIKGKNGSGKSTLVKVICGLLKPYKGRILFKGKDITYKDAWERINFGMSVSLQGGRVFPYLTVEEHFKLLGGNLKENLNEALNMFPFLKNLLNIRAGALSGGQRNLLSFTLAVLRNPDKAIEV